MLPRQIKRTPMKKENPFEAHGVQHLSPSSINKFIDSPAKWLTNIAGFRDRQHKPAFTFGNAIEAGITAAICEGATIADAINAAHEKVVLIRLEAPETYDLETCKKRADMIERVLSSVIPQYRKLGVPISNQRWVEYHFDDFPIPIRGILDFEYENVVSDLKTTGKKPGMNPNYERQLAVYALATDKPPRIDYVYWTKREAQLMCLDVQDLSEAIRSIERVARKMLKVISISSDIHEVCDTLCLEPDLSNTKWDNQWGKNEIAGARKLFSIT